MGAIETLVDTMNLQSVAVGNSATLALTMRNAEQIRGFRLWIKNTGAAALSAAALEGSFDDGTTWIAIDAAAVTTAFGTLGAGAASHILEETNIHNWPLMRITLTCGTSTTVQIRVVEAFN